LSLATPAPASKVIFDIEISSDDLNLNKHKNDVVDEDSKSTKEWITDKAQDILDEVRTLLTLPEVQQPTIKLERAEKQIEKQLVKEEKKLESLEKKLNHTLARNKRQLAVGGGFGLGFGAYDYNDYYGDYVGDYAYDYYDWICTDTACQLCDILTSECCDPDIDINCYLPDSCINNPCLAGGTCITSRTIDGRPDFVCACLPGLTGKYCQLANDYFVGAEAALAAAPVIPRPAAFAAPGVAAPGGFGGYQSYGAPAAAGGYGGYGAPAAAGGYGGYGAPAAAGGYGGYGTQQLAFASRSKRSLEDDMDQFVTEYHKLLSTLESGDNFQFTCQTEGKGDERHVLNEDGTKSTETFCQCFDKTFGTNCANKNTKVNCHDDAKRRTSAGHYVPRQYFIECTGNLPNVIKCAEGKIFDKEAKECVKHSLKKQNEQQF